MTNSLHRRSRGRLGMTLIDTTLALVTLAIVSGAIIDALRQQTVHQGMIERRAAATHILSTLLEHVRGAAFDGGAALGRLQGERQWPDDFAGYPVPFDRPHYSSSILQTAPGLFRARVSVSWWEPAMEARVSQTLETYVKAQP